MLSWNLSFDYAAIVLLLMIVVWYLNEKRIPLKSHVIFFELTGAVVVAAGVEIAVSQIIRLQGTFSEKMLLAVSGLWGVAICAISVLCTYYLLVISHTDAEHKLIYRIPLVTCISAAVALMAVNYFKPIVFSIAADGSYVMHSGAYVLLGINVLTEIVMFISVFRFAKEITLTKTVVLLINIIVCIAAAIMQIVYGVHVLCFFVSVACLTLYHYIQNPGAAIDQTTRLFNRSFMGEYVGGLFSAGKKFDIITIAMDDFKFINKTYGVDTGDELLRQIGDFLMSIRKKGAAFRFGSDQFSMVIKNNDDSDAVAQAILERFKHPWYSESSSAVMMSSSICVIECPKEADSFGSLVEVMDYSMAVAKKTRKGNICKAVDVELDKLKEDKAVEKAVKLAMDRDELMVYYQPIFSIEKNTYNSAEALVRLKDDELGWISPEIFIPLAEKNGLIIEMGDMILEKVCHFIEARNLVDSCIEYIEVNISPVQLMQNDFVDRVIRILERHHVPPRMINIEITETATIAAMAVVNENIGRLVDYGICFSLDDYGSGYSNIDYINQMPFSIIKLDKFIVWDAFKNRKAGITLEYTIGMLNALKLLIVAEGVETEEMKDRLAGVGCHYMQGWYYSKAISEDEFIQLIGLDTEKGLTKSAE